MLLNNKPQKKLIAFFRGLLYTILGAKSCKKEAEKKPNNGCQTKISRYRNGRDKTALPISRCTAYSTGKANAYTGVEKQSPSS